MDTLQLPKQDNTAKTLIILLLLVTIGCWLTMIWSTYRTYQEAPPIPKVMVSTNHQSIMTLEDIVQGKEGFQKADLMDYGSLYGMGSYFGEDYTAQYLVELSQEIMKLLAQKRHHKSLKDLPESEHFALQREMQKLLKNINLTNETVILPEIISQSISTLRS
jgi:nitric oxide reductase subunit B